MFHGSRLVPSDFECTVANILEHGCNWERYLLEHRGELEVFQVEQIEKMLACQRQDLGGKLFVCSCCGEIRWVPFTCMSRICSHCGKIHSELWGKDIMNRYLDVSHRHVIFTLPDELWGYVRRYPELVEALFQAMWATVQRLFDERFRMSVCPGVIALFHYTGRDMKYNPHIHALVTEGGLDDEGHWQKHSYWPYERMRYIWQEEVIKRFRMVLPKDLEIKAFLDWVSKNRDGFVVKNYRDLLDIKDLGRYLSRYVRHPPIGESRILDYDGYRVLIKYEWENRLHTCWIPIDRFIDALISNIPQKHFKVVRYYGMYANTLYGSSKLVVDQLKKGSLEDSIQVPFCEIPFDGSPWCYRCGMSMDLVLVEFWSGVRKVVKIL